MRLTAAFAALAVLLATATPSASESESTYDAQSCRADGFSWDDETMFAASRAGDHEGVAAALAQGVAPDGYRLGSFPMKFMVEYEGEDEASEEKIDGATSLMVAAHAGHIEVVEALLSASAEVDLLQEATGTAALKFAAIAGHLDVVKSLVGAGANLDLQSEVRAPLPLSHAMPRSAPASSCPRARPPSCAQC